LWGLAALLFFGGLLWLLWPEKKTPHPVTIQNAKLSFDDPPNCTGMAVTFEVINNGPPVSLGGFQFQVCDPMGDTVLTPDVIYLGKVTQIPTGRSGGFLSGPSHYPHQETFGDRPIAQGEQCRRAFFRLEAAGDVRTLYGSPKNSYALMAQDSTGKRFRVPVALS
jgi:hypothetical protein